MVSLIHQIRSENYIKEVANERKTVLLLCMTRDDEFHWQMQIVENIARRYLNKLKVVLLDEHSMEASKKDLGIAGTPTFLILKKGKEISRLLGMSDLALLRKFIDQAMLETKNIDCATSVKSSNERHARKVAG